MELHILAAHISSFFNSHSKRELLYQIKIHTNSQPLILMSLCARCNNFPEITAVIAEKVGLYSDHAYIYDAD